MAARLSRSAFICRAIASTIARRLNVLDLDAGDLHAPSMGCVVDHLEQTVIDLVPFRQELVEVHRAHHGTDIRHGEVENGRFEIRHLVAGTGGIQDLEEGHAIHPHHRIVAGDHLLARHVDHLLHHIELAPNPIDERDDQCRPGVSVRIYGQIARR